MRRSIALAAFISALLYAPTAFAEDDPMEVQRCIWRCLADSKGADDPAYQQCVSDRCNESPSPQSNAKPSKATRQTVRQTGVPGAGWVYGEHPVLGLSAHIQTRQGAIGLTCEYHGDNRAYANILSFRATDDLFRGKSIVYMIDGAQTAGTLSRGSGGAFAETKGNSCDVGLTDLGKGGALIIVDGEIAGIASAGTKTEITISNAGRQTVVTSPAEARSKLNGRVVSLKGSSAAIDALVGECPAARYDIENNCGL